MTSFDRISIRSLWMVVSLVLCTSAAYGGTVTGDCFGWELNGSFGFNATIVVTATLQRQNDEGDFVDSEISIANCETPPGGGSFVCSNTWSTELPEGTYRIVTTEVVANEDDGSTTVFHPAFGPFGCLGPICNIIVFKEGCVVPPAPDADACDGKVTQLTLRYTGEGCDATQHPQDPDKVSCDGGAGFAEPVRLLVTNNSGSVVFADVPSVPLDGEVVVVASNAGLNHLPSSIRIRIFDSDGNELESIEFHTSCSQPLAPGNQFGSIFIAGMITTEGGEDVFEEPGDTCITEFLPSTGAGCDGKILTLQLRYTGGDCSQTSHSQDPNKVSCSGDTGTIQPVRILVTDKNGDRVYADVDNVPLNGVILASAANAGQGKLKSSTKVRIFDSDTGLLLQEIEFHTSCSQPLELGDQFGSIQIFGMETTKGGAGALGAEVDYSYTILNGSSLPLTDVLVIDDTFGTVPGSPIAVIEPGETVVLTLQAIVTETTVNTVLVTGIMDGETCAVNAMATITAIEPPPGAEDCCEDGNKLQQIAVTYTGEGCQATMHSQDPNKVTCEGDPLFESVVHIRATDRKNPNDTGGSVWFEGNVALDAQFIIDATAAGKSKLKSNTYVHIFDTSSGDLLQTLKFHTSCSQSLFVGDQFGSIVVDGCTPEGGPLEGQFCVGGAKPSILTMSYTGAGCGATAHSQNPDKVSCEGDAAGAAIVRIRASNKEDPDASNARVWFDDLVVINETFDIAAANADRTNLGSNTYVHIFDLGDTLLETIKFHTSCSQPLNLDDRFGSLTLAGFISE